MTNVMKDVKWNEKLMFYSTGIANGGRGFNISQRTSSGT